MSFILLLVLVPSVSADSVKPFKILTPEQLISYYESTASLSTNSFQDSKSFINKYKSLPREKQEKIVKYLNDPNFLKTLFTATTSSLNNTEEQSFFNGDLIISTQTIETTSEPSINSYGVSTLAIGDTEIFSKGIEATATLLGIDWYKLRLSFEVEIKVVAKDTSKISRILRHSADVIQNWVPMAQINKNPDTPHITSDGYYAYFTCNWEFKEATTGIVIGTKHQWISVSKAKEADGGMYNL